MLLAVLYAVPSEGESLNGPGAAADYVIDKATGCWEWQKTKLAGYGLAGRHGRAHRAYYKLAHGLEHLDSSIDVHHKCRNPGCVNPDHLEALPRGKHRRDHAQGRSHITAEQVKEIRRRVSEGELCPAIAADMGLVYWTVWNISVAQNWADVAGPRTLPPANCAFELCAEPLPDDRRPNRIYCDRDCRTRAWRHREGIVARPHLWKAA